jgi:electron transfer flavoprotein beta subunit
LRRYIEFLGRTAPPLRIGVSFTERRFVKIGVCVKQVPAKDAPLAIADASAWIRESDIGFETNEPDGFALEEALRLKEKHGGEVVVISMGPERAKQAIKEALAKGAERGIHVADSEFYKLDPLTSARSLAAAIEKENFDLILTGLQSEDQGFGQTGVLLAELLGRPHATIIMAIEVTDGRMKLKRELEAGWFQWVELPLPAVITIQSGINKPRYATLKGIMAAKKKDIATVERGSLGVTDAGTERVERIYVPQKTKKTEFISGTAKEAAAKLIEKLRHEARVL